MSVVQCGGAFGASAKVNLQLLPNLPIVSLATLNITYTDPLTSLQTQSTITAPWYELTMSITNNSTEYLTLAGFLYNVSYLSSGGLQTTYGQEFTVTNLDPRFTCQSLTGAVRSMIVEGLAPNETYSGLNDPCDDYLSSSISSSKSDIYYVSSLPTSASAGGGSGGSGGGSSNPGTNPALESTSYFLQFYAQGWFEADGRNSDGSPKGPPIERFIWEGFMTTQ